MRYFPDSFFILSKSEAKQMVSYKQTNKNIYLPYIFLETKNKKPKQKVKVVFTQKKESKNKKN